MWRRRDEGVDDGNDDKRWVDDFNSSKIIDAALKQNKKTGKDEDESKNQKNGFQPKQLIKMTYEMTTKNEVTVWTEQMT